MMDVVLRLREARRLRGLSQRDVARLSGVHEKTVSSFETGERIESLKLSQLMKLLRVYGMSVEEFFGDELEERCFDGRADGGGPLARFRRLVFEAAELPEFRQEKIVFAIQQMVDQQRKSERRVGRIG